MSSAQAAFFSKQAESKIAVNDELEETIEDVILIIKKAYPDREEQASQIEIVRSLSADQLKLWRKNLIKQIETNVTTTFSYP